MNFSIYQTIKQRILFFDYEPGQPLNEKQMAAEFGVSRTPVREVLLRLEWEKLVSIIPRAGIMVAEVEFNQLREVFQTRAPLEGLLGRLTAARINDFYLSKLEAVQQRCETIMKTRSRRTLLEVDMNFREVMHEVVNNDSLRNISDLLYFQTQRLWHFIFDKMDFDLLVEDEIEYMSRSVETFRDKNLDKAENYRKQVIFADLNRVRNIFEYSPDIM
ncbi:GntR family transcriptional regulator [Desulforhopalus singaporensis]|uniref:DNA-binding transcriptional regulator, GntR family n=1 Tax=Desulforhopalus singaporensis TaxID=91360 RepID=A0A1H0U295_9BACT|nr:GntR family transcriptional regulator [Desulforhopalus singaporensis]SDP60284.1 DNA-binding transcriptional regulator, GntR family [Desulforhopalus singaporensis]